jgi:3-oxoacyl-[acyl-carrier protein] reductase
MSEDRNLAGKVGVVTGAGRGIGRAIALALAGAGASVVCVARGLGGIEATADTINATGGRAIAVATDVSHAHDVQRLASKTIQEFGKIDILVNSAGVYGPIGPVVNNEVAEWFRTVEVNLGGVFLCSKAFLPYMIEQHGGKIINLSGGGATSVRPNFSCYAASKAAVVRFTECLAAEVALFNVQVNAISPGGVYTPMVERVIEEGSAAGSDALAEAVRIKASGDANLARVKALAIFLAGEESDGLTGRLISAVWDDWESIPGQIEALMQSDAFTLRRVSPRGNT